MTLDLGEIPLILLHDLHESANGDYWPVRYPSNRSIAWTSLCEPIGAVVDDHVMVVVKSSLVTIKV